MYNVHWSRKTAWQIWFWRKRTQGGETKTMHLLKLNWFRVVVSSATACLWTIVFFSSSTFFSFSSWLIAESLYSCHLFTMSKMATAAVVAWFYELNSNKQRELMARGVEQSEKGNCYKRRQLVYSIYNILWWRHRVIGLLTKYNIYTW